MSPLYFKMVKINGAIPFLVGEDSMKFWIWTQGALHGQIEAEGAQALLAACMEVSAGAGQREAIVAQWE